MESLHPAFERLISAPAYRPRDKVPERGIYLFTEAGRHLYVGRSNCLHGRRGQHCWPSSSINSASFAALIARRETGLHRKDLNKINRDDLLRHPGFCEAFARAKLRISRMEFRYVEEQDQTRQALLEIYVATALGTEFNDFETH